MAVRYTLRMQFGPNLDPMVVGQELLDVCRTAQADEIMLMIYLNEKYNGHETLDELRSWLDLIRPWKQQLQQAGVEVSLNPGHTVGQSDRGRRLKPGQNWQTMMDWKGRKTNVQVCPLDPGWRSYMRDAIRLFAAEGYRVVWLEDDIRLANHAPLDWGGCFCPLHLAEFNRRAGLSASREEIVQRVLQPGEPHPWRAAWLDMWDETQTAMVAEWREIVQAGGSLLGLMSSGPEMHAMEGRHWARWWQSLAGDKRPVHRPHVVGYNDALGSAWTNALVMLDLNRGVQPADVENGPEIENSPHGWAKSYRQTTAAMVLAQAMGAERLNISLYEYPGNLPSDDPQRAAYLGRLKPALAWLGDLFAPSLQTRGIGCPWREDASYRVHTRSGEQWMELHCRSGGWASWLGGFGHAFQMCKDETLNALAGELAWAFVDGEIEWMLQRGLMLDGLAASILVQRGFGAWLGLSEPRFVTQQDVLYSAEEMTDERFTMRVGSQVSLNDRVCTQRLLQGVLAPGAQAISVLRDPKNRSVGHGVTLFENALGGRVAICPWDANGPADGHGAQRNVQRAAQLEKVIAWLARGTALGRASGAPGLVSRFLTDGRRWRGIIWNTSPDAVRNLLVELPQGMAAVAEAVQIDADGNRLPADWDGTSLRLGKPLHQHECIVLRDHNL